MIIYHFVVTRFTDSLLQIGFVTGIILVMMLIYFTRISGISANDQRLNFSNGLYSEFQSVYQFEQEEARIQTKIYILQAEYANDLTNFQFELNKIDLSEEMSELEKREKITVLTGIYSDLYFDRKLALIDQEKSVIEGLKKAKCQRYCVYQDLPN